MKTAIGLEGGMEEQSGGSRPSMWVPVLFSDKAVLAALAVGVGCSS